LIGKLLFVPEGVAPIGPHIPATASGSCGAAVIKAGIGGDGKTVPGVENEIGTAGLAGRLINEIDAAKRVGVGCVEFIQKFPGVYRVSVMETDGR
jgi:hypothetical protein